MYSNAYQWKRIRKRVLMQGESKRNVARTERISINTLRKMLAYDSPPGYRHLKTTCRPEKGGKAISEVPSRSRNKSASAKQRWMEWLYELEQGSFNETPLTSALGLLTERLSRGPNDPRKKILVVLAHEIGFSNTAIAQHLAIGRHTARGYLAAFKKGGAELLLGRKRKTKKADDPDFKSTLFALLHEPPTLSGYNRTTWRMEDLRKTMEDRGHPACGSVIREAIKNAGFRWRSAKVVLTSNDPQYREKLERVQDILSGLQEDERFFSIDEFGPFAIKMKPGVCWQHPVFSRACRSGKSPRGG